MSNHHRSLNARVKVPPLLELLGCHVRLQGLPLRTHCPVCSEGVLTIYHDHVSGGGWHLCDRCGSQGDLIALVAAVHNVTTAEAIVHLAARGFDIATDDAAIRRYHAEHVQYDAQLVRLWNARRDWQPRLPQDFVRLTKRLGLQPEHWASRWPEGIGQIVGCLTKTQVETGFAPTVMQCAKARGESGSTSSFRVLHGEDWDIVAALPFFDLPGRIASFVFVGRNADPKRDFVIKRANRGTLGNQFRQPDAEAGLAFHPGIFEAAEMLDRTILAVSDPTLMLRLQVRHLHSHTRPLPLVCWYDSNCWPNWQVSGRRTRTCFAWQMLCGYKIVLWSPNGISVPTLRQAIAAGACISTAGPRRATSDAVREYLWKKPPADLWRHIVGQARPWPEALTADLEERKNAAIDTWLAQIEHERVPLESILTRCSAHVQERLNAAIHAAKWPRTIELNGNTVVEANTSWSLQRNGRPASLICNAILRIDRLVFDRDRGLACIHGRILYGPHEVTVQVPLSEIEKDPFRYMRDLLLEKGHGLMISERRYSKHALQIAMTFQPPQQSEPLLRVGLDSGTGRLVLPSVTLVAGGQHEPTTAALVPEHIPATNLSLRTDPIENYVTISAANPSIEKLTWATIACVATNIIATELEHLPTGLCLAGRGAQAVGTAVAESLGCVRLKVARAADVQVAIHAEQTHNWPIVLDPDRHLHRQQRHKLLRSDEHGRRCITHAEWVTSRLLLLHDGWSVITAEQRLTIPENLPPQISAFLPAYLCDLMGRWCSLHDGRDHVALPLRVLRDIAEFVGQHGGDAERVLSAADVLIADGQADQPQLLIEVLGRLVSNGRLKLSPQLVRGAAIMTDIPSKDTLVLTHEALVRALSHLPTNLLDSSHVTRLLENSGVWRGTFQGAWLLCRKEVFAAWSNLGTGHQALQASG